MNRVERRCGCGAAIVIESDEPLDVLLDRCEQWERAHKAGEAELRERLWSRQTAVENIVAAFNGADKLELNDDAQLWLMGLQGSFSELNRPI